MGSLSGKFIPSPLLRESSILSSTACHRRSFSYAGVSCSISASPSLRPHSASFATITCLASIWSSGKLTHHLRESALGLRPTSSSESFAKTKLYDRPSHEISLDEVERIKFQRYDR